MDLQTLTPAIFSLLGVALGSLSSALAAFYAHRTSREQQRIALVAAQRDERREAILDYVRAVQESWRFLEGVWGRRPLVGGDGKLITEDLIPEEAGQRMHELWYQQQRLAVMTDPALHGAALKLNEKIQSAIYDINIEVGLWQHINPAHSHFLALANADLRGPLMR